MNPTPVIVLSIKASDFLATNLRLLLARLRLLQRSSVSRSSACFERARNGELALAVVSILHHSKFGKDGQSRLQKVLLQVRTRCIVVTIAHHLIMIQS